MAAEQETGEFAALAGDPETGVEFPSEKPLRPQSPETDDVGGTALTQFEADHPYEAFGFSD